MKIRYSFYAILILALLISVCQNKKKKMKYEIKESEKIQFMKFYSDAEKEVKRIDKKNEVYLMKKRLLL